MSMEGRARLLPEFRETRSNDMNRPVRVHVVLC
jgi:hypothetical protein